MQQKWFPLNEVSENHNRLGRERFWELLGKEKLGTLKEIYAIQRDLFVLKTNERAL